MSGRNRVMQIERTGTPLLDATGRSGMARRLGSHDDRSRRNGAGPDRILRVWACCT